jgi:uncharacterized membrane protein
MKNNPAELLNDLKVIRTIHSNRTRIFSIYNYGYLIITIIVAVIITFIGFTGLENLASILSSEHEVYKTESIQFTMNLMVLSILIITILNPILNLEKSLNKHHTAVVQITEFITDVEFLHHSNNGSSTFSKEDLRIYSERYKSLINSLPRTKDKDYFRALKTIKKKSKKKKYIQSDDYDKHNKIQRIWKLMSL